MEEEEGGGAKVRVVRCPKCDKLLPELANFTVYRCGGCNATLQAKKQSAASEDSPVSSGDFENLEKDSEKKKVVIAAGSGAEMQSDKFEFGNEAPRFNKCCSDRLAIGNGKCDVLKEVESPRVDSPHIVKAEARDGVHHYPSKSSINSSCDHVGGPENRRLEDDHESRTHMLCSSEQSKLLQSKARDNEAIRAILAFPPTPTKHRADIIESSRKGPDGIGLLEQDRAEILRKLDELRDQLRRSSEVAEEPKERVNFNSMAASSSSDVPNSRACWIPGGSSTLNCNPSYIYPFSNEQKAQFYPAALMQSGANGFREAAVPCSLAPFHRHGQYLPRPSNNYLYGQLQPDPVIPYHNEGFYHQLSCSCMHCCNVQFPPSQFSNSVLSNNRVSPHPMGSQGFYAMDGSSIFGSQGHKHRVPNGPHCYEPHNHPKTTFTRKERRPCHPFGGAAPFIVCCNCSELLQIPEGILQKGKHRHNLRCGSCSQLISFELDGRRLTSSNNASTWQASSANNNNSSGGAKDVLQCHGKINRHQVMSCTTDYDSPSYNHLGVADEKIVLPSFPISRNEKVRQECGENPSDSEKLYGLCTSSNSSDGAVSPDSVIFQRDVPSSTELPAEGEAITRVPSLPLCEHFGYASRNQVGDDSGSGSRSKRSDQEKVISLKGNFKQNSVKDVPVATERDFSADDYPQAGFSQDSWEAKNDEDEPRVSKDGESFFAGLIKKSFRDFSRFNQPVENGRSKVLVNGHLISARLVKKAEKFAGPVHAGEYWYDYRAGFWGVTGHACLGIIPPFIEEFNYPMHKNCAGGNTGVLVNGRELHENDLTLLASRGLPVVEGRAYIIEISGKVWDEETGEELDSLGKLAPTVERMKRGFGMRASRAVV
ncbi:hypothetical protein HPP92_003601 [Vanilla planifolia]|uniref:Zinc-ribbon domain-containing protein n=1 Tax=Vanilla planifolia TaxID=51239 RepID=A0A835VK26_VANPL|nr:hypothetical protein HPP92_003601 [Vanilla planifolia]